MTVEHPQPEQLDKLAVRRAFDRAAASYDDAAVLQHEIGQRMVERLQYVRLIPRTVLDVGAGTGRTTAALARRYPKARIVASDLSPMMLARARRAAPLWRRFRCAVGDAERLPFADGVFDLLFSNLALQWCNDLGAAFAEFRRVLRPGGLLMFSTFGPDTLKELRQAWAEVDGYSHVSGFPDMHDVGDALVHARFADPVMDVERLVVTYPDVQGLMRDLKAIGAHNATAGRPRGMTGAHRLRAMTSAYEQFRRDGVLPASYEVVYGHAWLPDVPHASGVTCSGASATVAPPQPRRRS